MTSLSNTDPLLVRARELLNKELPLKPTLWLKPPGDTPSHHGDSRFYQPWYPEHQRLKALGWQEAQEDQIWGQVVVFGGRYKQENQQLLEAARTRATESGRVYFVVPNDYGAGSWAKSLKATGLCQQEFVGRKSRLFVLAGSNQPLASWHPLEKNQEGLFSHPGLFSWESRDQGSELLAQSLAQQTLKGPIADLGSGWGYLSYRLPKNTELHLLEADWRGVEACRANLTDHQRASFHWTDVSDVTSLPRELVGRCATVITNPPFHTNKKADPVLGGAFVSAAHRLLTSYGTLFLVGNSHLPYKQILEAYFPVVEELVHRHGYSIFKGSRS